MRNVIISLILGGVFLAALWVFLALTIPTHGLNWLILVWLIFSGCFLGVIKENQRG